MQYSPTIIAAFPRAIFAWPDGTRDRLVGDLVSNTIDIAIMTHCGSAWDDRTLPLGANE